MRLSSTRFQLYCVDQVFVVDEETGLHVGKILLTTLKLLTVGENTTSNLREVSGIFPHGQ
jgi:hypothetical protein